MLKVVCTLHTIERFFISAEEMLGHKLDKNMFFNGRGVELWEDVAELLLDAIAKYTPQVEKDPKKKTEQLEHQKRSEKPGYSWVFVLQD